MKSQRCTVVWTTRAKRALLKVRDARIQEIIVRRAEQLVDVPEWQGKLLTKRLAGLRAVRAVGQRYRIIYYVHTTACTVHIIHVGIRREGSRDDVYVQADALMRLGLLRLLEEQ